MKIRVSKEMRGFLIMYIIFFSSIYTIENTSANKTTIINKSNYEISNKAKSINIKKHEYSKLSKLNTIDVLKNELLKKQDYHRTLVSEYNQNFKDVDLLLKITDNSILINELELKISELSEIRE